MGNKSLGLIMLSMLIPCLCSSSLYDNTMPDVFVILWFQGRFDHVTSGQVCHWTCAHLISPMTQKYMYFVYLFLSEMSCFSLTNHSVLSWWTFVCGLAVTVSLYNMLLEYIWRLKTCKCTVDSQAQRGKHNCILPTFPYKYSLQTFASVNWNSR